MPLCSVCAKVIEPHLIEARLRVGYYAVTCLSHHGTVDCTTNSLLEEVNHMEEEDTRKKRAENDDDGYPVHIKDSNTERSVKVSVNQTDAL